MLKKIQLVNMCEAPICWSKYTTVVKLNSDKKYLLFGANLCFSFIQFLFKNDNVVLYSPFTFSHYICPKQSKANLEHK